MEKKINFAFFGTPDVASETLEILKQKGFLPSLVVTSPDAKSGRGLHLQASPVAVFAQENNIPFFQPQKLNKEFTTQISNLKFDLFIVVAYGKIIPEKILTLPKFGSINIHYSLLPKYRGASPVESAILNGDTETGITIQQMEFEMDSGPVLIQEKINIFPTEKALELRKRLIKIGGELLAQTLPKLINREIKPIPQNKDQATYCKKNRKENGLINLEDNAVKNYNKFRAYAFWPRTFFFKDNKRIIITDAEIVDNNFIIKKVIPEGKKEIDYKIT